MQINSKASIYSLFCTLIILNLAIALKYTIIGVGINLLLVCLSVFVLFFNLKFLFTLYKHQIILYLLPLFLLIPLMTNPSTFKFRSFFYGLMFLSLFQVFICFLYNGDFTINKYKKNLLLIIRLYFYVALLQSILFPLGIKFNMIWNTNPQEMRINSLATEPSYSGIIVVIAFYSYLILKMTESNLSYSLADLKKDYKYWFFVTFIVTLSQSGFAIVFFIILLLTLVSPKNRFAPVVLVFLLLLGAFYFDSLSMERVLNMLSSIFTLDTYKIVAADHSGSIRVAPVVIFLTQFNFFDLDAWIGHGMDYSKEFFARIIPGINIDVWKGGGFFPAHIYNYGLISTIAILTFFKKNTILKLISFETLFIFLMFLNSSFNSQLFWYIIVIFTSNKYFLKHIDHHPKNRNRSFSQRTNGRDSLINIEKFQV